MPTPRRIRTQRRHGLTGLPSGVLVLLTLVAASGCASTFNPAFLALVTDPVPGASGAVSEITMDNAPGHVPIMFINNTRFDQRLLDYLETTGTDVSDPDLRPRVRVRVEVEYVNGSTNVIELLEGSDLVQATIAGGELAVPPELTEFTLRNFVAMCDVAKVEPLQVEIFVPVTRTVLTVREVENNVVREFLTAFAPAFEVLRVDMVDNNNNTTITRNFDIRNRPVPIPNVQCGGVVAFTLNGTLSLSFTNLGGQVFPGYLDTDNLSFLANPGRFEFLTSIR